MEKPERYGPRFLGRRSDAAAALAMAMAMGGDLPISDPFGDRKYEEPPQPVGTCQCGGRIFIAPSSKKPRCATCKKIGRFKSDGL